MVLGEDGYLCLMILAHTRVSSDREMNVHLRNTSTQLRNVPWERENMIPKGLEAKPS